MNRKVFFLNNKNDLLWNVLTNHHISVVRYRRVPLLVAPRLWVVSTVSLVGHAISHHPHRVG